MYADTRITINWRTRNSLCHDLSHLAAGGDHAHIRLITNTFHSIGRICNQCAGCVVCIFDCAVDSYFAFLVDPVLFYTRHSASPRGLHVCIIMRTARYSVWQTEHFDFGNHHASHDATSRRSSSLVLVHE